MHRAAFTLLCLAALTVGLHAGEEDPNLVWIVADDLGWRDLGTGDPLFQTPALDELAREGVVVERAYSACAVCSPSRAALLTGYHPARLGLTDYIHPRDAETTKAHRSGIPAKGLAPAGERVLETPHNMPWLPAEAPTLAELLASRGYATAHVGKWHLGGEGRTPTDRGFDENHGGVLRGSPPSYFDPFRIETFPPREEGEYLTDREADAAVSFIERNHARPFFLHVTSYAVHSPFQAPKELVDSYLEAAEGDRRRATYAAMVAKFDGLVGQVLEALDRHELDGNTLVVFTSDNGGASHLGASDNRPLRAGKGFAYEGGSRVPLVLRWTGVLPEGGRRSGPVIGTDLLPTCLAGMGLDSPEGLDGHDLWGHLVDGEEPAPRLLSWHFPHYWWGGRVQPYSSLVDGGYKLIRRWETGEHELYDLEADPGEERDLASSAPDRLEALTARLDQTLEELGARLPRQAPSDDRRDD